GLAVAAFSTVSLEITVACTTDPTHSLTVFSWSHFGFSTPSATLSDIQAIINVANNKHAKSSVIVNLPIAWINTNVKALDDHIKTAEFFDAAKYPNITFKSTKVQALGKNKYKITGNLTVKDVTKPVVLDAVLNKQGVHPMTKLQTIGFNATTS